MVTGSTAQLEAHVKNSLGRNILNDGCLQNPVCIATQRCLQYPGSQEEQVAEVVLGCRNQVAKEVLDTLTNNLNNQLGNLVLFVSAIQSSPKGLLQDYH